MTSLYVWCTSDENEYEANISNITSNIRKYEEESNRNTDNNSKILLSTEPLTLSRTGGGQFDPHFFSTSITA